MKKLILMICAVALLALCGCSKAEEEQKLQGLGIAGGKFGENHEIIKEDPPKPKQKPQGLGIEGGKFKRD